MEKKEKSFIEALLELLGSRTVWSGIASLISLLVFFRTGTFLGEIGIDDESVINATEKVAMFVAILANLGIPYFRYKATHPPEKKNG